MDIVSADRSDADKYHFDFYRLTWTFIYLFENAVFMTEKILNASTE
jgi:hypothetical protein